MSALNIIQTQVENACITNKVCYTSLTNNSIYKDLSDETSPYYDESLPKMDHKYLAPVRKWEKRMGFVTALIWTNVIGLITLHMVAIGMILYLLYNRHLIWKSLFFTTIWLIISGFGVTGGVHRYWTHRSYKASLPMQLFLFFAYSIAGQKKIYDWVRDHRLHHKMSETSADPHNANRGFWFSHIGWMMMKKHPHVIREGKKIEMSDIINDPLIKFYDRYFNTFVGLFCFATPITFPPIVWRETWTISICLAISRYVITLNCTWAVNSFAHLWGTKPYDKNIMPAENWIVSAVAAGEGWHNYHHTFPWDYKAAELPHFINLTTLILDFFAHFGWVYDTKTASPALVEAVMKNRCMNKSHECNNE